MTVAAAAAAGLFLDDNKGFSSAGTVSGGDNGSAGDTGSGGDPRVPGDSGSSVIV
jgi:hypothetical protein